MEDLTKHEATMNDVRSGLDSLKRIADDIGKIKDQGIDPWLESVKSMENDVAKINEESIEMCRTFNSDDQSRRIKFHTHLTESVNAMSSLKETAVELFLKGIPKDKLKRFSREDIISFTAQPRDQIGSGSYGRVYRGHFANNTQVAIKELKPNSATEEIFMIEVRSMFKASHPNIVQLYGFCFDSNMKALVYELMEKGSLDVVLLRNPDSVEWQAVYNVTIKIAKALAYLHNDCGNNSDQIIHHDVKPSNVLLDRHLSPKLTDFGTARIMNKNATHFTMTRIRGSRGYTAPEMFTISSRVTCNCDVYSFGMILFDVLGMISIRIERHVLPYRVWDDVAKGQLEETIKKCNIGEEDWERAKILSKVALWCIQFTPERRPSMTDVVNALEKKRQVPRFPNPFYPCEVQQSQDRIYSTVYPSTSERPEIMNSSPKMGIEHPWRLEENLKELSTKMGILEILKEKLRKQQMPLQQRLEEVERIRSEFQELEEGIQKLNNRGTLQIRFDLNRKLIGIFKTVNVQLEAAKSISETIEELFRDLPEEGKLKKFTSAQLRTFTAGFSTKNYIHGNGTVCKGRFPSGEQIVVKVLKADEHTVGNTFMAELNTLLRTSHKNLVKLYGYCFEKNMKALVLEYTTNGSLDMYLYEKRIDIEWETLYDIAVDTAKGLSYLHNGCEKQIIHHDVKASNVLLADKFSPRLTNFGVTKIMRREKSHVTLTRLRKGPACPPEMMQAFDPTCKYDVYTFGMMLLEVLGRRRIVSEIVYFPNVVWDMFEKGEYGKIMKECGHSEKNREKAMLLCMVAFWCIQFTPENRPSMDIVVKMLERKIQTKMPPKFNSPHPSVKIIEDFVYDFENSAL